jgi:hypothetical protein
MRRRASVALKLRAFFTQAYYSLLACCLYYGIDICLLINPPARLYVQNKSGWTSLIKLYYVTPMHALRRCYSYMGQETGADCRPCAYERRHVALLALFVAHVTEFRESMSVTNDWLAFHSILS